MEPIPVTEPKRRDAVLLLRERFPQYDNRHAGWMNPPEVESGAELDRFTLLQLRFVKAGQPDRYAMYAVGALGMDDTFTGIQGRDNAAISFTWQALAAEGGWGLDPDFVPVSINNLAASAG